MPDRITLGVRPVRCGSRTIYPLIRISEHTGQYGGYISAMPVALIIEEAGEWFFTILGEEGDEFIGIWLRDASNGTPCR